jgi:lipoyl-dependent peroxiredoxin
MKTLYTIKATSVGGRNGYVRSDYNLIDADVRLPKALGGKDDEHLTPEVFFAAGYAACFDNAVMHIIRMEKVISEQPVVTAKVDLLYLDSGMVGLAVELLVEIPGLDHEIATELVRKAHQICPYSNATRGNIEVKLTIK